MSRSGYNDDAMDNPWGYICYRGQVASATRGKRGQQFFKDLLSALDAMPIKRLIAQELETHGEFCTLGALGHQKGIDLSQLDTEDTDRLGKAFNIAQCLAAEVMWENDERCSWYKDETPEDRYTRMHKWVQGQIK